MSSTHVQYHGAGQRRIHRHRGTDRARGIVLISTLLLLIVMTILALSMFRNITVQELIAGNVREKQRAFQAASDAEQYAEYWLSINDNALTNAGSCNALVNANTGAVQICSGVLSQVVATGVTSVPWMVGADEVGFYYNPGSNDLSTSAGGGINTYYGLPRFYISALPNASATNGQALFQVDAWGYGGTTGTVAEVESTWQVTLQVNSNIQGGATGN